MNSTCWPIRGPFEPMNWRSSRPICNERPTSSAAMKTWSGCCSTPRNSASIIDPWSNCRLDDDCLLCASVPLWLTTEAQRHKGRKRGRGQFLLTGEKAWLE